MQTTFPFVILITAALSFLTIIARAANPSLFELANYPEMTANTPDLADIPQGDDFLCADVNEDGDVNVLDIISMVNYIMGGSPNPFNMDAADVNADGGINVLDIIALVNIMLTIYTLTFLFNVQYFWF